MYVRQHSLSSPGIGAGHYRTVSSSGLTANNGTVAINGSLAYVKIGREGDNFYKRKRIVVIIHLSLLGQEQHLIMVICRGLQQPFQSMSS